MRSACLRLLEGRATYPSTPAAKMLNAEDVKKAKSYVAQLNDIRSRNGAAKSSEAQTGRQRDVLHAAVELFYDRFAAAVDVALEDDDAKRVLLLSLVPRRKERRVQSPVQQKPPVPAPAKVNA